MPVTPSYKVAPDIRIDSSGIQEQKEPVDPSGDYIVIDRRTGGMRIVRSTDTFISDLRLEHDFYALSEQWRRETMFQSLDRERACNFAYHQIIGMGKEVLPYIFNELEETTSDWFWALRAITRTDVEVKPEDKGNVHKIAEAWMEWGSWNGYVSKGRYRTLLP
jgi:hypothetical protein